MSFPSGIVVNERVYNFFCFGKVNNQLVFSFKNEREFLTLHPKIIEQLYKPIAKEHTVKVIKQNKFDCAAASIAQLLGHSLYQVKQVMGSKGWCNDIRGCNTKLIIETVREFGMDLVICNSKQIYALGPLMPDGLITVGSLNYSKAAHTLTWLNGECFDPNYGRKDRKFWHNCWAPHTVNSTEFLLLTEKVVADKEKDKFKHIKDTNNIREFVFKVAA